MELTMPRQSRSIGTRLVAAFFFWIGVRALWFLFLGSSDPDLKLATELGFGGQTQIAAVLTGVLTIAAALLIWRGSAKAITVGAIALIVYFVANYVQLQRTREHPEAAKQAYAASRIARGLPAPSAERLDQMFGPRGQQFMLVLLFGMTVVPLGILWLRRGEFRD